MALCARAAATARSSSRCSSCSSPSAAPPSAWLRRRSSFFRPLVVLARRLGYDNITAGAIGLVGAGAGFAGAFLNPFTVGVAQDIAGLPVFSGLGFRLVVWAVLTIITVIYIVLWSRRRKSPPAIDDQPSPAASDALSSLGLRRWSVLAVLLGGLAAVVVGATSWGWGIFELSGLFVAHRHSCRFARRSRSQRHRRAVRRRCRRHRRRCPGGRLGARSAGDLRSRQRDRHDPLRNGVGGAQSPGRHQHRRDLRYSGAAQLPGAVRQRSGRTVDSDPGAACRSRRRVATDDRPGLSIRRWFHQRLHAQPGLLHGRPRPHQGLVGGLGEVHLAAAVSSGSGPV